MKIKFLGATHQVTGSSYLLEVGGTKILIDCGLFQEHNYVYRNSGNFPYSPDQIQYLLLTHVHLDHLGLIPKLVKDGFKGRILLTPASKELFPIVILDSARMLEEDAAFAKKQYYKKGRQGPPPEEPLYTVQDAEACFPLLKEIDYGEFVQLNDSIKVRFHNAAHILGSAMIEIIAQDEQGSENILFSGDIGQWNSPLLGNPAVFDRADYVVMESTYGDRNHESQQEIDEELSSIINETVGAGGNILIPTFAIERAQDVLYHLNCLALAKKIPYVMTFLDSPMAVKITEVFEKSMQYFDSKIQELFKDGNSPFEFPGLVLVETVEASKSINLIKGSTVILAGSGMITGGRIEHHLAMNIARPESTLLFVGYQAPGTLGYQLLNGASNVKIHGQDYPVRIKIRRVESFSAHAGMSDLKRWLDNFKSPPKRVFLTHGEDGPISSLENYIQSKNGWTASAPTYLEEFEL